jgi:phage terminase small subunit
MPRRRDSTELSPRERMFVREYLVDLNASQAGIRAGYAPKQVGSNIYRVLRRPRVAAAIATAMAARERDLRIDAAEVLREIARLGFANLLDYIRPNADGTADIDLSLLTRDQAAAIAELTVAEGAATTGRVGRGGKRVHLKLADKTRNLKLLGRHLGLFAPGAAERLAAERAAAEAGGGKVQQSDEAFGQEILGILGLAGEGRADG